MGEAIDRITAAHLMALRSEIDGAERIAHLLRVPEMTPKLAARTLVEILEFVGSGDAVAAAQLIHSATVRRRRVARAVRALLPGKNPSRS